MTFASSLPIVVVPVRPVTGIAVSIKNVEFPISPVADIPVIFRLPWIIWLLTVPVAWTPVCGFGPTNMSIEVLPTPVIPLTYGSPPKPP